MDKEIVISDTFNETRVALLEDGSLKEIYHEREIEKGIVGNIYKGKVLKVLPGMEAAFVDIGVERAAFLYIDDVLPESYLFYDSTSAKMSKSNSKKSKPSIEKLLKEGQDVLVQVSKGPISTKGARITSHISLPGRNLVFMPTVNTLGVSRQISNDKERARLKALVNKYRPDRSGFIIRTVADNSSEDDIKSDINFLVSLWDSILDLYQTEPTPSLLHGDLNVVFRTIRDLLSPDVKKLLIDNPVKFEEIKAFVKDYLPRYYSILENYTKPTPLYDHLNIETEIERALSRKVYLKSGGSLIIDETEALTTVDVNTGRFVGNESHEQTILKTNLESAEEIVYQLRLRNIGGIIIIDFIDMELNSHRQQVYNALKEHLKDDKARSKILQISEMGLVEMTRKRDRESLSRYLCDPCPYCEGSGTTKTASTIGYEIFREIYRSYPNKNGSLVVYVNTDVHEHLTNNSPTIDEIEKDIHQKINFKAVEGFHTEQYEIYKY